MILAGAAPGIIARNEREWSGAHLLASPIPFPGATA
jgi:hypothetical protein